MAQNTVMMTLDKYDALMARLHELESLIVFKPSKFITPQRLEAEINIGVLLDLTRRNLEDMYDGYRWEVNNAEEVWISEIAVAHLKDKEGDE